MRHGARGVLAGLVAATAVALPVAAQTVYRCGPDGRSYSQQPCAEGKAVSVGDARSDAQRREAEATAGRDARTARMLERERLAARPAASAPAGIAGRGPAAADPPPATQTVRDHGAKKKRRKPAPDDADFRAAVPKPARKKPASSNA